MSNATTLSISSPIATRYGGILIACTVLNQSLDFLRLSTNIAISLLSRQGWQLTAPNYLADAVCITDSLHVRTTNPIGTRTDSLVSYLAFVGSG